ncbi:hypothetical protein DFJ74DRAFT_679343 [Hyaloraphidium curvatum]|nr:hypothetical protein DFJ74DRAFT_679343 [Hyaloraphidium curvatum]
MSASSSKLQLFAQKLKSGSKKRDGPTSPVPVQFIKSPFDAMPGPSDDGVTVVATLPRDAAPAAGAPAPVHVVAPVPSKASSTTSRDTRASGMLNDILGTFDELLSSKQLEAVQEEAKASVYAPVRSASTDMIIDESKGVARVTHTVGGARPSRPEEGGEDSADDTTVDDSASLKHKGGGGSQSDLPGYKAIKIARHLNIVEDLDSRNPDVPTPFQERKSRRRNEMDDNDFVALAESFRQGRNQRGAWLKDKSSASLLENVNAGGLVGGGSAADLQIATSGDDLEGTKGGSGGTPQSDETASEAMEGLGGAEAPQRSPGVNVLASSPSVMHVPDTTSPPGASEEWMNALIRENALVNAIGQQRSSSSSIGYVPQHLGAATSQAMSPSAMTVAAKIQAFESQA